MTNTSSSPVTDAMVERAWAAIVGTDVAGMCFQASIIRADLRTALEAVISPAQQSLVDKWRSEAKRHREAETEAADRGDEEAFLHGVEADRLEKCAAELAGVAQPSTSPETSDAPETLLRAWAKAYRETPEHRFPSDPDAEFFPVDLEAAANEIERLRSKSIDDLVEFALMETRATNAEARLLSVAQGQSSQLVDFAELKLLIDEYDPSNSDWNFRRGVLLDVLVRLWPKPAGVAQRPLEGCSDLEISDEWERRFGVTLDPAECIPAQTATREALEEINALISNGDRPTVNERNAFEHFTVLNRLLLNIRDIARRALSSVPSTKRNTDAAPANRSTAKATANVGDNGERMGSEPAMGIVTGGSDPTPSMMTSTVQALTADKDTVSSDDADKDTVSPASRQEPPSAPTRCNSCGLAFKPNDEVFASVHHGVMRTVHLACPRPEPAATPMPAKVSDELLTIGARAAYDLDWGRGNFDKVPKAQQDCWRHGLEASLKAMASVSRPEQQTPNGERQ